MRNILDRVTEAELQSAITELAELSGWRVWHDNDSRQNAAGWPDLVLAKPGQPLLFWEVKTERGRIRVEQQGWQDVLGRVRGVSVRVVRPRDWALIKQTLLAAPPLLLAEEGRNQESGRAESVILGDAEGEADRG